MNQIKIVLFISILLLLALFPLPTLAQSNGPVISNFSSTTSSVKVYEKYEAKFDLTTTASNYFFQYDSTPPSGITPKTGITVEGIFTANGKTWTHPGFYMTETTKSGSGSSLKFTETNKKYWVIRFSPQEQGTFNVQIRATDASGITTFNAGSFTATTPTKDGFIKVSPTDNRYFEFSNGKLFWPIGPIYSDEDFSKYKDTGLNFVRPWMGGSGAYSANWARWKSSAEQHGNEGISTRVSFTNSLQDRYPNSDGLAYNLEYPNASRYWLTSWMDESFFTPIKPNTNYQIKLSAKTTNITGPRNSSYPYGLVIKFGNPIWGNPTDETVENTLRNSPKPFSHITQTQGTNGWQTFQASFTTPSGTGSDIWVYLDNVTGGKADIYELSIKENGAEIIRNPTADMHTYVEQRPAAFFDWQVQQAEANGIYLKYNVHDKNDPIFRSLNENGTWASWLQGTGYDQPYNTKSSWLKRQWYRYLIARWGYSTAVHSWEAVNEANPNDISHWQNVQENLAHYTKNLSAHPVLSTTSFWCCSLYDGFPFYSNSQNKYPDIDYLDLHEYSGNPNTTSSSYTYDMAEWVKQVGEVAYAKNANKPLIWAENGLSSTAEWWNPLNDPKITSANSGTWYHNMLWSQLTRGAAFATGYWFDTEHIQKITNGKASITKPFYNYINDLDLNRGGFNDAQTTSTNTKIRTYGQKKSDGTKAYIWIQNADHTWNKTSTPQSSTITTKLTPSSNYIVQWWNTYNGTITQTQNLTTNSTGNITLPISNLSDDLAVKIIASNLPSATPTPLPPTPTNSPTPTSTPLNRPCPLIGDTNLCDNVVNALDFTYLSSKFGTNDTKADLKQDGVINVLDYSILSANFGNSL